jgi:hypothetical protein
MIGCGFHALGLLRVGGVTYGAEDEPVHLIQPIERRLWQGVSVLQVTGPAHGKALESYIKPRLTSDSRFHDGHRPGYDLQTYVVPFHHTDSVLHMRLSVPSLSRDGHFDVFSGVRDNKILHVKAKREPRQSFSS